MFAMLGRFSIRARKRQGQDTVRSTAALRRLQEIGEDRCSMEIGEGQCRAGQPGPLPRMSDNACRQVVAFGKAAAISALIRRPTFFWRIDCRHISQTSVR